MAKDKELLEVSAILGIFALVLIIADVTYKNLSGMFSGPDAWTGVIWAVLHVAIVLNWYVVVKYWQDPNKNFFRVILFLLQIAAIGITLGHRAGWLEQI